MRSVFAGLCFLAAAPPAAAEPALFAVNAGSPDSLRDLDGTVYVPDRIYRPTATYGAIAGRKVETGAVEMDFLHRDRSATEDSLHSRQRIGPEGYVFQLAPDTYEVTIHSAEFQRHGAGHWRTSIWVEDEPLVVDFDGVGEVGEFRIVDIRGVVTLEDSLLNVDFEDSTGTFPVSGISIRPGDPTDDLAPAAPAGLAANGAHGGVLLVWDRNLETDLAGYRVLRDTGMSWEVVADHRFVRFAEVAAVQPARYGIVAFDVYGNVSDTTVSELVAPGVNPTSELPRYGIEISEADRLALDADPRADVTVTGDLWVEDQVYPNVSFSYRGSTERIAPKKSWNINLEDNPPLDGAGKMAIKATFSDPTVQREPLYAGFMRRNGLACAETFPVRVEVNGDYRGVQMSVERVNEDFLARRGWNPAGRLYRASGNLTPLPTIGHYRNVYESSTIDDWDRSDLVEFIEDLDKISDADILPWLEANVEVEQVLDLVCHHAIVANIDWVHDDFFLFRGTPESRWQMIPWDLHESFGWFHQPVGYGTVAEPDHTDLHNQLVERMLTVPSLRRRYTEKLRDYIESELTSGRLATEAEEAQAFLGEDIWTDMWKFDRERELAYSKSVRTLVSFFEKREAYLLDNLGAFEPPEHALVHMAEVLLDGEAVTAVEILNLGSRAFDFTGFALTDDLADLAKWPLESSEISAMGRLVVPVTGATGGSTLALTRVGEGADALVDSVAVPVGMPMGWSLGRYPDTSGRWRILPTRSPGQSNIWSSPVSVTLGVEPREVAPGAYLDLEIGVENTGSAPVDGQLRLLLETRDGLRHPLNPLKSAPVQLAAGQSRAWTVTVRAVPDVVEIGGGELSLVFVQGDDDEVARASREIFVVGDPAVPIVINEFLASNDSYLSDEMGEFDDWIELHNASDAELRSSTLYLTDDLDDAPLKWALPEVAIEPRGYLVVWCDNDLGQGPLHANFKLSAGGEEIALVDGRFPDEPIVLDHWVFGSQDTDVSTGRYPDGNPDWLRPDLPTGGAANVYTPGEDR